MTLLLWLAGLIISVPSQASAAAPTDVPGNSAPVPATDEWSRFRGPNGKGVLDVPGLPSKFDVQDNLLWRTPLAPGHSSPVLFGDRLFLTTVDAQGSDGAGLHTLCIETSTGQLLWSKAAPQERQAVLDERNNGASPSAVTDGTVVVSFFPDFGVLGYSLTGEERWRVPLAAFNNVYGMGASPILAGDRVLLACDQSTGSYLLCLDKDSGEELWRSERPWAKSGHCTPILVPNMANELECVLPGSFYLDGYHIGTGQRTWWAPGLSFEMKSVPVLHKGLILINGYGSPLNQPGNQITLDPFEVALAQNDSDGDGKLREAEMPPSRAANWFSFVDLDGDGLLDDKDWTYLTDALASQNGMLAIRPGGEGELPAKSLAWSYRRAVPQLPSPLVYADVLYMLNDSGGLAITMNPVTGELIERGRIEEGIDNYYASPVAGDGKVYLVSEHGTALILPAGGSLDPIAVHEFEERVYATPALAKGKLFLRTEKGLYCFTGEETVVR